MRIPIYQVDAFAREPFSGNPAAVCPLEAWLDDDTLASIAAENNLSETAFFVRRGDRFDLRWFTPEVEVDLCGHATLASARVIFGFVDPHLTEARFSTKSGELVVRREGEMLAMDFPSRPPQRVQPHENLIPALGAQPEAVLASRDYLVVYRNEGDVKKLRPDMAQLAALDRFAVIVTAPGRDADFVSRFFAPGAGIDEDPVTGSAHCTLIPYWSQRLGKKRMFARQVSARGGELWCEDMGERVKIAGHTTVFLQGEISL
ncbi:MAG: PhzF family phenazine biosynthesis protein [Acidobacteriales bacterium]|nr:PhzF family phenazine biosynthesis protein [Terriglobales bacterium]